MKMLDVIVKLSPIVDNNLLPELLDIENHTPDRHSNVPGLGCDVYHADQTIAHVAGVKWVDKTTIKFTLEPYIEMIMLRELIDINGCSLPGEGQRFTRNKSKKHSELKREVADVVSVTMKEWTYEVGT